MENKCCGLKKTPCKFEQLAGRASKDGSLIANDSLLTCLCGARPAFFFLPLKVTRSAFFFSFFFSGAHVHVDLSLSSLCLSLLFFSKLKVLTFGDEIGETIVKEVGLEVYMSRTEIFLHIFSR